MAAWLDSATKIGPSKFYESWNLRHLLENEFVNAGPLGSRGVGSGNPYFNSNKKKVMVPTFDPK